ncbi:MAG: peptidase S41, partial [Clostridium sp.]
MKSIWTEKWHEDLEFFRVNLIEGHKNLFFNLAEERFNEMIDKLKDDVDSLEYDDMKVELSRIAATVGDAHTSVVFPVNTYL